MTVRFAKPERNKEFQLRIGPGPYIMRLSRLEDAPENQWGEGIFWYWKLYNTIDGEDGKTKVVPAQFNEDGTEFEWRERTSIKFGKNPKNGQTAAARLRAEALLKRDLDDEEVDELVDDPQAVLKDKYAFGYLTIRNTDDGKSYLNLQAIEPYRRGMLAPVQRIDESADGDLPFGPPEADGDTPLDNDGLPS